MAVQGIRIPFPFFAAATTVNSQAIDLATDGIGFMVRAPKAGNIEAIGFNITALTGAQPTYRAALESGTTTRQPNGTVLGSGTAKVDFVPSGTGWTWQTLDSALTVTAGQQLAATVRYLSGTIGASNNISVAINTGATSPSFQFYGYAVTLTAGTWAVNSTSTSHMAIRYDDGTVIGLPYSSISNYTWNNGSSPRYRGLLWTPNADVTLAAIAYGVRPQNASNFDIEIYEGTIGTPISTTSIDIDIDHIIISGVQPVYAFLPSPLQLTAGTAYRIIYNPTSATSQTNLVRWTLPDAGSKAAWFYNNFQLTTATTPGTWTDTDNETFPFVPILDGVDIPTGGGSRANIIGG